MSFFSSPTRSNNIPSSIHKSSTRKHNVVDTNRYFDYDPEKEPIKAYLRIRPRPENHINSDIDPYIEIVDNDQVIMHPPKDSHRHKSAERYRFTHIFDHNSTQHQFFNETTLALVRDVLSGHNALLFAYGVTNSGKTYSIMGKEAEEEVGLLPRTLYTIFQSIQGHKSEAKLKPAMHSLVMPYDNNADENRQVLNDCQLQENLSLIQQGGVSLDIDRQFEYGIWVSFIEIYNEQIYDLLDVASAKRLQLKTEHRTGNKYVSDAKLVKVKSMEEADAVMRLGHQNRRVFSTLMNQTSSRSHSVFTIHVVRCPIDGQFVVEDAQFATVSRFSIVDLAGSERYRNTNSTGQRLREAGNINKSLMVLGQCMETLRINQVKADLGKPPSIVPFRHSKLTELFKGTFEGDGKAVIIVNVNPFDTGFDENNHVMKFAAVAKNVTTTWRPIQPVNKIDLQQVESTAKRLRNGTLKDTQQRDEVYNDGDDDDDALDGNAEFIDSLIGQLEDLWEKWVDAEARNNTLEFEVRDQVSREMDIELKKMEDLYLSALKRENNLMNIQLENRLNKQKEDDKDDEFLKMVHEKQSVITEEISYLKQKMTQLADKTKDNNNNNHAALLERIVQLEKENQKEHKEKLQLEHRIRALEKKEDDIDDMNEDDDNDSKQTTKGESFQRFLNLRKQLRKSIFKKEELGKDADTVMSQVEQFEGVTFSLAKETKMGKLLKLIIQEEFEKDPYQIRNRAIQLFKRYAQLTSTMDIESPLRDQSPLKSVFSSLNLQEEEEEEEKERMKDATTMTDRTDIEEILKTENIKLRQRIKILNEGQRRLKEAFEKTVPSKQILPRPPSEDIAMIEDKDHLEENPMNDYEQEEGTEEEGGDSHDEDTEYQCDMTEIFQQNTRQKRRRKLRER
ncbi:MAG: P-loop containing nucleoside triphosphate hydrolase protein [Benjaminiella poitrasii]|nr:MAG: P-loop containing nucleoside triphosphate hydrolase protein [Benjaminiella poitrasii]